MKKFFKSVFSVRDIWFLLFIMVFTVVFRVGLNHRFSHNESMKNTMAWVDSWDYVNYSKAIFSGIFLHTKYDASESNFYRIDEVPPVYPIILAVYYELVGYNNLSLIVILNLIFNLFIIYLTYLIAKKMTGSKLALLPAFLWGVYINSLILTGQAIKEPVITIFILLIVYMFYRLWNKFRYSDVIMLAIANAVFAHLDERYLFMTALSLVAVIYILVRQSNKNLIPRVIFLYIVLCALMYTPWQVRNYLRYNKFVLITPRTTLVTDRIFGYQQSEKVIVDLTAKVSSDQIDSIYTGYIPASVDTVTIRNILRAKEYGMKPHYFNMGERISYNTLGFWQMFSFKPFFTGSGFKFNHLWGVKRSMMVFFGYTLFFFLSLPAFYIGLRKRNFMLMFFLSILVINTLQHAVLGAGLVRYRAVMDPLIFIAAAYTLSQIHRKKGDKQSPIIS